MKRRLRWLTVAGRGFSVRGVGARMAAEPYSEQRGSGFLVESTPRGVLNGVFAERVSTDEMVEGPLGNRIAYKRVEYREIQFRLGSGLANLEIVDSPRSLKPLVSRIEEWSGGRVLVVPVVVDVQSWLTALLARLDGGTVLRLAVADVPLSPTVRADVVFEGTTDVRADAEESVRSKVARVTAAVVAWQADGRDLRCELSRGGAAFDDEVAELVEPVIVDALRADLRAAAGDDSR